MWGRLSEGLLDDVGHEDTLTTMQDSQAGPDRSVIRPESFPAILAVAETGINVGDLATMSLWTVPTKSFSRDVRAAMVEHDYDAAPLADDGIWRYVTLDQLDGGGVVEEAAIPIRADDIVHESVGLVTALEALAAKPFLFVLRDRGVHGILTRSDVQSAPATLAALGLVLAFEEGLKNVIRSVAAGTWVSKLLTPRIQYAEKILESRRRHNAEIDLLECVQFADLFDIASKEPLVQRSTSLSEGEFTALKARIVPARDSMAHGGSLLSANPDPERAIALFMEIRLLAERMWSIGRSGLANDALRS